MSPVGSGRQSVVGLSYFSFKSSKRDENKTSNGKCEGGTLAWQTKLAQALLRDAMLSHVKQPSSKLTASAKCGWHTQKYAKSQKQHLTVDRKTLKQPNPNFVNWAASVRKNLKS